MELDRVSRAGKVVLKEKDFSLDSKLYRKVAISKECDKFKTQLVELNYMEDFLKRKFETAYDDEHAQEEELLPGSSEGNVGSIHVEPSSKLSSMNEHSSLNKLSAQVPSLPERDASKFFLLSHMLDYLCETLSFDLHGKVRTRNVIHIAHLL